MKLPRTWGVVRDDAGERCEIVPVRELHTDERRVDEAFASVVDRCGRAWIAATSSKTVYIMPTVIQFVVIGIFIFARPRVPVWTAGVVGVVLIGLYVGWHVGRNKARAAESMTDIALADGLCPGCLYNLAAQAEQDGLVRCPECGARWSATRIVRRHAFVVRPETEFERQKRRWRMLGGIDGGGPTRIKDDQDRMRPIVSGRLRQQIRAATGNRRVRLLAARREIGRERRVRRWIVAAFFFFLYATVSSSMLLSGALTGWRVLDWLLALSTCWCAVYMPMMIVRGSMGFTAVRVREGMLRHGLCPSCGFDLDMTPDDDGVVECGECGAAWRAPEHAQEVAG